MFEYQIWLDDSEKGYPKVSIIAETPGKAKYNHYLDLKEYWLELTFKAYTKMVRCKKIGPANHECMFTDKENFERMTKERGIKFAYQGMRVEVAGEMGTLIGNYGMNLWVVIDGVWRGSNCHPWWETRYFDKDGNVIKDYRESRAM